MHLFASSSSPPPLTSWLSFIVVVGAVWWGVKRRKVHKEEKDDDLQERMSEMGIHQFFTMGTAVAGLDYAGRRPCFVAIGADALIFFPRIEGRRGKLQFDANTPELGRIPLDAVDSLNVHDASTTRTVDGRRRRRGFLGLFLPRRSAPVRAFHDFKYQLIVRWTDKNGIGQESLFEFMDAKVASESEQKIRMALKPKGITIRPDERTCPTCAEIIKAAAIKCRFCGAELAPG